MNSAGSKKDGKIKAPPRLTEEYRLAQTHSADQFKRGRRIAQTEGSTVYRATLEGFPVALKELKCSRSFLMKETISLLQFNSSYTPVVYAVCYDPPCLVSELFEKDLWDLLRDSPPLSWVYRIGMSLDTCNAVNVAHNKNKLHRDIKTANLFCTASYRVKIGDFETMISADSVETGAVATSHDHTAPELFSEKSLQGSYAAEIYAIGIVMWAIALQDTKKYLNYFNFANKNPDTIAGNCVNGNIHKIITQSVKELKSEHKNPEMDILGKLILECIHPNPSSRPNLNYLIDQLRSLMMFMRNEKEKDIRKMYLEQPPEAPACVHFQKPLTESSYVWIEKELADAFNITVDAEELIRLKQKGRKDEKIIRELIALYVIAPIDMKEALNSNLKKSENNRIISSVVKTFFDSKKISDFRRQRIKMSKCAGDSDVTLIQKSCFFYSDGKYLKSTQYYHRYRERKIFRTTGLPENATALIEDYSTGPVEKNTAGKIK